MWVDFFVLQNIQKDCKCSKIPVTTKQKPVAWSDIQIGEGQIFYVFLDSGLLTGKKDLAALRLRQHFLTLGCLGEPIKKKSLPKCAIFLSLPAEFFLLVNIIAKAQLFKVFHPLHFHEDNQKWELFKTVSNLYNQHGAQIHKSKIKSYIPNQPSQPGTPPIFRILK